MRRDAGVAALAVALAAGLKWFYSTAAAEDLGWILAPTAWAAGAALGGTFSFEPGYGYVSRPLGLALVPACAGVNFLIAALGSLLWAFAPSFRGAGGRCLLVAGSLAAAYVATVAANTSRIVVGVLAQRWAPCAVDPARLHRLEGAVVYLCCLFMLHIAADRLLGVANVRA